MESSIKIAIALFALFVILMLISISYYNENKKTAVDIALLGMILTFVIAFVTLFVVPIPEKMIIPSLVMLGIVALTFFRITFVAECKKYDEAFGLSFFGSALTLASIVIRII